MPCDSKYLEATWDEKERRRAAILYRYTLTALRRDVPPEVEWAAEDYYGVGAGDCVPPLCALIRSLADDEREALIYNAHSMAARDLANWWEEHQVADYERNIHEGVTFHGIEPGSPVGSAHP